LAPAWKNKGKALRELNLSAEAAMAFSMSKGLDFDLFGKNRVFILVLLLFLAFPGLECKRFLRAKADPTKTALFVNVLGFLPSS
jgi:hypothetical protein